MKRRTEHEAQLAARRASARHELRVKLVTAMVAGGAPALSEGVEVDEVEGLVRAADAIIAALEARRAEEMAE